MELFETRLNADDKPLTAAQLIEAVKAADVLVPTVTDRIDSRMLSQAGPKLKLIASVRHRRRPYRSRHGTAARHHRHQHAGRADRGHRRHVDGVGAGHRATHGRGRASGARGQVGGLEPDLDAGRTAAGQAHGHRRHGAHRPGAGASRARLRARDPLSQPQTCPRRDRARARGDLLGKPRPDAGAHGHRLGELPAHAGDLPPPVGTPPQADEAHGHHREHRARRSDRREQQWCGC